MATGGLKLAPQPQSRRHCRTVDAWRGTIRHSARLDLDMHLRASVQHTQRTAPSSHRRRRLLSQIPRRMVCRADMQQPAGTNQCTIIILYVLMSATLRCPSHAAVADCRARRGCPAAGADQSTPDQTGGHRLVGCHAAGWQWLRGRQRLAAVTANAGPVGCLRRCSIGSSGAGERKISAW